MKTRIKKICLDLQEEENWLNEQGEKGLMLVSYQNGEYIFEDVSPAKFQYKIDLPNYSGKKKKDYFSFLEQSGISTVCDYGGRAYLRKNKVDGPLSLYTDNEGVRKQMSKKYMHFFSIGLSQFLVGLSILIYTLQNMEHRGIGFWFAVVVEVGLIISGIIFFVQGIRKHRKYSLPEEEKGIWEE